MSVLSPKTVIIVQARMGSTRLPGKVMKQLIDQTVLSHVIHRLQAVNGVNDIAVATTTLAADDVIVDEAQKCGVRYYRGSEQDVLSRYYETAVESQADIIVRITSDCPVIDPFVIEEVIRQFNQHHADYASNTLERSFPRGLDTEVFTMNALEEAYHKADNEAYREHVTPYLYRNPNRFKLVSVKHKTDCSNYRWTLDTVEDWELINEIYNNLYQMGRMFHWQEVLDLMVTHPQLAQMNAHVEQKKLTK